MSGLIIWKGTHGTCGRDTGGWEEVRVCLSYGTNRLKEPWKKPTGPFFLDRSPPRVSLWYSGEPGWGRDPGLLWSSWQRVQKYTAETTKPHRALELKMYLLT